MLMARSSLAAGDQNLRLKSGRRPLQPKNSPANPIPESTPITKSKQELITISVAVANKENHPIYSTPPAKIDSLDASLAEELSAIRKKLERLRSDRERTEKFLREKDMVLELKMKELEERGEIQKKLEIEVDRLYRLNELKSHSMRVSPIRSLREKEQVKKINEGQSPELKLVGESVTQSPGSASSGIVVEK
ncbi:hypothetical protein FH972_017015 [Carpinus fangiana]|uniref:Uncharacterized protein n=1 Tax=Carpinus fangiana TaxID=176857 RepID=A0A5N6RKK0_9ROSI|nr:hypothetical protein FH972_017015 [Carpinus fangiana]